MLRRKFIQMFAAVGALAGLGFVKHQPTLRINEDSAYYVRVSGSASEIAKFHDAYQTHLWPDWKTHRLDDARKQAAEARREWDHGHDGLFYSGGAEYRSAIAHARRVCDC